MSVYVSVSVCVSDSVRERERDGVSVYLCFLGVGGGGIGGKLWLCWDPGASHEHPSVELDAFPSWPGRLGAARRSQVYPESMLFASVPCWGADIMRQEPLAFPFSLG